MQEIELLQHLGRIIHEHGFRVQVNQAALDEHCRQRPDMADNGDDHTLRGTTQHLNRQVTIADMRPADQVQVTAHELGHVLLHDPLRGPQIGKVAHLISDQSPNEKELTVEVFSHLVASHFGLGDCQAQSGLLVQYVLEMTLEDQDVGPRIQRAAAIAMTMASEIIRRIEADVSSDVSSQAIAA